MKRRHFDGVRRLKTACLNGGSSIFRDRVPSSWIAVVGTEADATDNEEKEDEDDAFDDLKLNDVDGEI